MQILVLLLSYLFGSIPIGLLIARLYNIDITKVGSGNIGATNIQRNLGWGPALVVLAFDIFKGGIVLYLAKMLGMSDFYLAACALAAVLGHNYSIFLKFKGGKGVATSIGTLLVMNPLIGLGTVVIAVGIMYLTRFVSAGSMMGGIAAVLLLLYHGDPLWQVVTATGLALLILWTHRDNFQRLQAGTERRLGSPKEAKK
ncbi:glycerol-3-phosphate 1-O-acyltransferase PlsY [Deinococcus cellulosilyticus]|uniref:Glycerol-3-phosphate acyltransferase n=1 Tax=Deinococcus cellulosilyticus (strain DSM 18568 / NBRC 106333 / KACC 11606 / 5516J-15) TaxID=1223518 RepID=A0A511N5E1_DEIC1|nr:glycerol-3-phosphate 1-O-acyltransferase PlsY [Deinococcus cellulosilyticus]GEM48070.1 glycerol-3-phosphate acyltransferase [Deinococcus cellulosilyticus NBRC 106333 = KACC 11606]